MNITWWDIAYCIAFLYQIVYISVEWHDYSKCSKPLNVWLLVTLVSVALVKIVATILEKVAGRPKIELALGCTLICLLFPFITAWAVVGTIWYALVTGEDQHCLEGGTAISYMIIAWLLVSYLMMILYFFVLVAIFAQYRRAVRNENATFEALLSSENGLLDFTHAIGEPQNRGLEAEDIERIPILNMSQETLAKNQDRECSICLAGFQLNSQYREIPGCQHLFHSDCIEDWLNIRSVCPNCKADVREALAIPSIRESSINEMPSG
mmetsp:Transcript_56540/g.64565  ORF Transcript_56540/g.64565 Transcript_56540/m.64565 type:complete len:266 (+) Transcript_56540:241-1038(+)